MRLLGLLLLGTAACATGTPGPAAQAYAANLFSAEGCDMSAKITCADGFFGLTRCSMHGRRGLKLDAQLRKIDESIEKDRREMCSLPMSWNFGDLCKPRTGP